MKCHKFTSPCVLTTIILNDEWRAGFQNSFSRLFCHGQTNATIQKKTKNKKQKNKTNKQTNKQETKTKTKNAGDFKCTMPPAL